MLSIPAARTLAVMSITGLIALNIPAALINSPAADAQAAPTGCIDVLKEVFDPQGNRLPIVPGFTFRTDTNQQGTVNSSGFVRISNVPAGLRTVTEMQMSGWTQVLVTPSGGQVFVAGGDHCSGIVFKNRQQAVSSSSSSSSSSSHHCNTCSHSSSSRSSRSSRHGHVNQNADIDSNANTNVNVTINAGSNNNIDIDQDSDGVQSNQDADVDANADTDVNLHIDAWSGNDIDVDQDSDGGNANQDVDVDTDSDTDVNANIDAWSGNGIEIDQDSDGGQSHQDADVESDSDTDVNADINANSENETDISQNADGDSGNMGFWHMNTFAAPSEMRMAPQTLQTEEDDTDTPVNRTQALFNKIMLKLRSSNGSMPQWTTDAVGNGW